MMLEFWYQALREEVGICIRVDEVELAKQKLYRARAEAADETLRDLSLVESPTTPGELWILKR